MSTDRERAIALGPIHPMLTGGGIHLLPMSPTHFAPQSPSDPKQEITPDTRSSDAASWGDLVLATAELAFETDRKGVLTKLLPGKALGHESTSLLGRSAAEVFLADGQPLAAIFFQTRAPAYGQIVWLRLATREIVRARLDVEPIPGPSGGTRGIAVAVPPDAIAEDVSLARARVLARISTTMRSAFPPRNGLLPALETIGKALCADTAQMWNEPELNDDDGGMENTTPEHRASKSLHFDYHIGPETYVTPRISSTTKRFANEHSIIAEDHNGSLIAVRIRIRFAGTVVLHLQRRERAVWGEADALLAYTAMCAITSLLEFDVVMTEMLRDARFDILTGALNDAGFADYVRRALSRLTKEATPASVVLVGIDGLGDFNETHGADAGDHAVCALVRTLREIVRPRDVIGRLTGDIVAVWMETADQFTVSERANQICQHGLPMMLDAPSHLSLSIGFATRAAFSDEDADSLMHRARLALRQAKMAGGSTWKFAPDEI